MYDRADYEWFKAHRICPVCGKEKAAPGRVQCMNCLDKLRIRNYALRARMTTEERQADSDRTSALHKKQRRLRKEQGLCVTCGKKPARAGGVMCWECNLENNNKQRRLREKRRQEKPRGSCYFCDRPTLDGYKVCQTHYEHMLAINRNVKNRDNVRRCVDALWKLMGAKGGTT